LVFIQTSRTRFGIVALVALMMLAVPSIAAAGDGSAVSQYTECPPQCGKVVGKKKVAPLPKKSKNSLTRLHNRAASQTLENIATKPQFGAPPTANSKQIKAPAARSSKSSVGSSLTAAIVSSGAGSKVRLLVLLVVIVGISVGAGVAAVRRQRL